MRRIAWALLVLFVFAIPWEYSLVLPAPYGNVARIAGLLTLVAAIPAVLQRGRFRTPAFFHWTVLALYLWWCCTGFWTIDPATTETKLRGYFQETMIVWLLWEFVESADDLRMLLRAWLAGSWVLAILTLANFASAEAVAASQVRFAATGQDPNDVARFLNLGLPLAALLFRYEKRWPLRWLAVGFLPVGMTAVLLTASRSGFVAAIVALTGSAIVLGSGRVRTLALEILALPAAAAGLWLLIPRGTLDRLATIPVELQGGDLNQRINIWSAGWNAFLCAPLRGSGAGTFVAAAHTAPIDTAHNTLLSIAVGGGLCAAFLALAIVAVAAWSIASLRGSLRITLIAAMAVWVITSLTATVEESRTTWLLLGVIAVAARLEAESRHHLEVCFASTGAVPPSPSDVALAIVPQ
jgi:O-antigen ligase